MFEQRPQGGEQIGQEATWERDVLEMRYKRLKFGKVPSDFQDQLMLK